MVCFPGQTHIPGLARVPALPRVPGLTRGTFPDAPSPFTPYLRDSEPYRRNKHHVGNNVTANSVSGGCTNPNNTDPTASPASSGHLGANSGSSAHQDCYKHSPQHGGESSSFPFFRSIFQSHRFSPQENGVLFLSRYRRGDRFRSRPSVSSKVRANPTHPLLLYPLSRGGEARIGRGIRRERDPPFREVIVSYLVPALHPLIQRNNDIQPAVSISSPADLQHDPPLLSL